MSRIKCDLKRITNITAIQVVFLFFFVGIEYKTTIIKCIFLYWTEKSSSSTPASSLSLKKTMHHGKLGIKPFSFLLACVVVATSCLANRIINQQGIVVNGWIARFKTDHADQDLNSNGGKLTLLLIYQSGFSTATSLPPNPRQKQRIRRPRPLLVLCFFFCEQLHTKFVFASLFAHMLAATHSYTLQPPCSHIQHRATN